MTGPSRAAEMRAYRARRREGIVHRVGVNIRAEHSGALVAADLLQPAECGDRHAVERAAMAVIAGLVTR